MSKAFYTLILIFATNALGYSQSLSIELSVEWAQERVDLDIDSFQKDSIICIPYLAITYRNNTDTPLYFRSMTDADERYLSLPSPAMNGLKRDLSEIVKRSKYPQGNYEIKPGNILYFGSSWEATSSNEFPRTGEYIIDGINYSISKIHILLKTQAELDRLKTKKKLACFKDCCKEIISFSEAEKLIDGNNDIVTPSKSEFNSTDFGIGEIDSTIYKEFIFLKEGEVIIKKISLIGFYSVGGDYNFSLGDKNLKDYVLGDSHFNEKTKKWEYKRISLPKKVKGYNLYSGLFLTNSVKVSMKK